MTDVLGDYEPWLRARGYAASTIRQSLIDARRIVELCTSGERPPARYHVQARRLASFFEDEGLDPALLGAPFAWLVSDEAKRGQPKGRKLPARSVDDGSWKALWSAVRDEEGLEPRALEVMMTTGLRVGDVLRLSRAALEEARRSNVLILTQKGGRERELHLPAGPVRLALDRLAAAWGASAPRARTLGEAIAPGAGDPAMAAYQRTRRRLLAIAEAMQLPGRAHTHRLRRTVAMQALRVTRDIGAVQQLLGHASPAATQAYIDEERPGAVADLSAEIHHRFLEED